MLSNVYGERIKAKFPCPTSFRELSASDLSGALVYDRVTLNPARLIKRHLDFERIEIRYGSLEWAEHQCWFVVKIGE